MRDLRRLRTLGGVVCLLVYAGASMLLVLRAAQVRGLEARACLELVGLLTTGLHTTSAVGDVVYFGLRTHDTIGLRITNECTTAVLVIPFLVIMGCLALRSSVALSRVLLATLLGVVMLILVNVLRIGGIAWATYHWGLATGYEVSHLVVGSLFALAGFVLSVMVTFRFLVRSGNPAAR
jgi:exosortase/archaeosortase family protein